MQVGLSPTLRNNNLLGNKVIRNNVVSSECTSVVFYSAFKCDVSSFVFAISSASKKDLVMAFLNILFQADVSRYEDSDFEEMALRKCGEHPETRQQAIEEFRHLIYERGQCCPRRMDDAYLLRFLRSRSFILPLAHKLMIRYEAFRRSYPYLYHCDAFGLTKVKNVFSGINPDGPNHGRILIMKFGRWDCSTIPADDIVRTAVLMGEIASLVPRLQVLGLTFIADLEGLGVRHVRHLTPTHAHQFVSLLGVNIPILTNSVHLIKYGWILNTFFHIFKQFVPEGSWRKLHFHGYDMTSLHKHIDPEYLPAEYGGTNTCEVGFEVWLPELKRFMDDFFVQELRDLGYDVGEKGFLVYDIKDIME